MKVEPFEADGTMRLDDGTERQVLVRFDGTALVATSRRADGESECPIGWLTIDPASIRPIDTSAV